MFAFYNYVLPPSSPEAEPTIFHWLRLGQRVASTGWDFAWTHLEEAQPSGQAHLVSHITTLPKRREKEDQGHPL